MSFTSPLGFFAIFTPTEPAWNKAEGRFSGKNGTFCTYRKGDSVNRPNDNEQYANRTEHRKTSNRR
jgi:hypothetical protein